MGWWSLLHESSVKHGEAAVAAFGKLGVVGHKDDGGTVLAGEFEEKIEDAIGIGGVEVARGLVGQDEVGGVGEGASYGDTLLFATGELVGEAVRLVG